MAESQNVGTLKVNFEIDYTDAAKFIKTMRDDLGALKVDFDEVGKAMDKMTEKEVSTINRTPTAPPTQNVRNQTPPAAPAASPTEPTMQDMINAINAYRRSAGESELYISQTHSGPRIQDPEEGGFTSTRAVKEEFAAHPLPQQQQSIPPPPPSPPPPQYQNIPLMPPFTIAPSASPVAGITPPISAPSPTGQPITMTGAVTITIQTGDLSFPLTDELKNTIINGLRNDLQNPMSEANRKLGRLIASVAHGVGGIS